MDALLELLLLGFSGGGGSSFSLGNGSLDSLIYRSLLLSLEVFGGDGPKLEQVALVISLLSLVFLFKFVSELLFSLGGFFKLCLSLLLNFL